VKADPRRKKGFGFRRWKSSAQLPESALQNEVHSTPEWSGIWKLALLLRSSRRCAISPGKPRHINWPDKRDVEDLELARAS